MTLRSGLDLAKKPARTDYFFFAGTQQKTVSEVRFMSMADKTLRVRAVERDDAGDGTVPIWSAMRDGVQTSPVGGEHGTIYKNSTLRQILAALLGKAGVLAAISTDFELALRDPVVGPGAITRAVLSLGRPSEKLSGNLSISKVADGSGAALVPPVQMGQRAITYEGPSVDRLDLEITAPDAMGIYRVEFLPTDAVLQHAGDDLFVQDSPP